MTPISTPTPHSSTVQPPSNETSPVVSGDLPMLVISEAELQILNQFEGLAGLLETYTLQEWSPSSELQILIDIARTSKKDEVRIKALNELQRRRREIMQNNGLVATATKTSRDQNGNKVVLSTTVVSRALRGQFPSIANSKGDQNVGNKQIIEAAAESPETGTESTGPGADPGTGGGQPPAESGPATAASISKPPTAKIPLPGLATGGGA